MTSNDTPGTVIPVNFVKPDNPGQAIVVLNETDDVAVALRALKPGEEITLADERKLKIAGAVPKGHKVSLNTIAKGVGCLLYTSPSPRDATLARMPSSA